MPLKPNLIERLLIHAGIIPGALLDTGISMFQASALLTAGDIGLFNHLKNGPLSFDQVREKTNSSSQGLQVLLNCMINLGYINKNGNDYSLTKAMKRSFPIVLFPEMIPFFRAINQRLNDSTIAVRTNPAGGVMGWDFVKSGEIGRSYQAAMRWLGSSTVKEVVAHVKFNSSPTRMLDIGGSHGLYCVEFCRKYPSLKATVLDWPIGLENAKITLREEKDVVARIDLYECDFEKENLPADKYDFIFLGNIIHGLNEEANQSLYKKIAGCTLPSATVVILDQYSNVKGSPFQKGIASLIGWNLFLFAGGRAYDFDLIKKWLENYGFPSASLTHLKRSPGFSFITARKK